MANEIDISQIIDPSVQQPWTGPSLEFLQNSINEKVGALGLALTGPITGGVPYVLSGCIGSGGTYSAGYILFNNSIYAVSAAASFTNTPVQYIVNTSYDAIADPLIFSDGSVHNVHQIITFKAVDQATAGVFNSNQFVYVTAKAQPVAAQTNPSTSGTGATVTLKFANELTDIDGINNTSTGNITPKKAGIYEVTVDGYYSIASSISAEDVTLGIYKNGTLVKGVDGIAGYTGGGSIVRVFGSYMVSVNGTTDVVTVATSTPTSHTSTFSGSLLVKFIA